MAAIAAIVGAVAAVGSGVASGVQASKAASAQQAAQKKAQNTLYGYQNRVLDFQQRMYDEASPFRDIALRYAQVGEGQLPTLMDAVNNPTTSEGFKLASAEGLKQIQQNFAIQGSPQSGGANLAAGRFMAGLSASQADQRINNLFRLAGFGSGADGTAQGLSGLSGSALGLGLQNATNIASLDQEQGATRAGLYGATGNAISGGLGQLGNLAQIYYGSPGGGGGYGGYGSAVAFDRANPSAPFPQ